MKKAAGGVDAADGVDDASVGVDESKSFDVDG